MDMNEKISFVQQLTTAVADEIITNIETGKIPEEWDGIELRWYIAEKFNQVVFKGTGSKARKRDYNNTVIVNNL